MVNSKAFADALANAFQFDDWHDADGIEDLDDFSPYDDRNDLPIADDYSTDDSGYISW